MCGTSLPVFLSVEVCRISPVRLFFMSQKISSQKLPCHAALSLGAWCECPLLKLFLSPLAGRENQDN